MTISKISGMAGSNTPDTAGRKMRRRRTQTNAKRYVFHTNAMRTRIPKTTSVCFSVVTVNDEHTEPRFKTNRRG